MIQDIDRELIVPYRKHSLKECDEIIRQSVGVDRSLKKMSKRNELAELHQSWLDACLNEATKPLSAWEEDFLLSIMDQLGIKGTLTEKQATVLERIYVEKTS